MKVQTVKEVYENYALPLFRVKEIVNSFPKAKVLVIGDLILDEFVWGDVNRISPEAPVPVVNVQRETFMPGGALNVANNIRTLKANVFPCGIVGRDLWGRMLLKAMRKEAIDTNGVISDDTRRTTLKTRVIAHSQQVVRFDREDSLDLSKPHLKQVLNYTSKKISEVDAVIIEDYGKGMINPTILKAVLSTARRLKKPVVVDPKEKHFEYYRGATVITPNRKEALGAYVQAFGNHIDSKKLDIKRVGFALLKKLKCRAFLITMGEEGMLLFEQSGKITKIPTAAQEVFDVSGAGDTVIAVFALALASGCTMKEAAFISNQAAGVVVGKLGTATVSPKELIEACAAAKKKKNSDGS